MGDASPHSGDNNAGILPVLLSKRVLITVGSGGVGKTTVAASMALQASRLGRKTLVMTIDPALRLATSLGLDELDNRQRQVPADKLQPHGLPPGNLFAMMLDPKMTFDEMVRRYAPDQATADRLMDSKLYQQISTRLAGAQEYAAMEKLHEIRLEDDYDVLVLDTPPTANAMDFLDAPQKMVGAVESPAINMFVRTFHRAGQLKLNLLGFGAAYVIRRLARFTGGGFLDDIAEFLALLSGMLGGMHDRAAQVDAMLLRDDVGFVIVTSPDPRSIDEAISFHDRLSESGKSPSGFVVNRVHPLFEASHARDQLARAIAAGGIEGPLGIDLAEAVELSHQRMQVMASADQLQIARLVEHCGEDTPYFLVPLFREDIYDIGGLLSMGGELR